jgi:hypothetical protein
MERSHDEAPGVGVGAEDGKRIAVHAVCQGNHGLGNGGVGKFGHLGGTSLNLVIWLSGYLVIWYLVSGYLVIWFSGY